MGSALEQILTRTDGGTVVAEVADQVDSSNGGKLKEAGDHYELRWLGSRRYHSSDAAGLADGAAGSVHAGEGDRSDRRSDRTRIQLRTDRCGRADAAGATR